MHAAAVYPQELLSLRCQQLKGRDFIDLRKFTSEEINDLLNLKQLQLRLVALFVLLLLTHI